MIHLCGDLGMPDPVARVLARLREPCCISSAEDGPTGCSCWEPVYDLDQQPPIDGLEPSTRDSMCADCAFRPDSPERSGDDRYQHSDDDVLDLDHFWCHQGIRKPIAFRHPSGIVVETDVDAYKPPQRDHVDANGKIYRVPYKADGSPADRCAGHAAHNR